MDGNCLLIHLICDVVCETNKLRVSLGPFGKFIIVDHDTSSLYMYTAFNLRMVHEEDTLDLQRYRFTGLVNGGPHRVTVYSLDIMKDK